MSSEEMMFENMFPNLAVLLPWHPIEFNGLDKIIYLVEDYSKNISVKRLSKYL